jgi:SAM-dependent methyltransferase
MPDQQHEALIRTTFEMQVPIFTGPGSVFAQRSEGSLAWIEPLHDDMIVLDVACGAGHAAEPVAPHVRQVIGVDLTPALLRLGHDRLREAGINNVLLQEANAESLPFLDESFDVVYCRASLHHFADPQAAVDEMFRVCRVGGRVVILDLIAPIPESRDQFDHVHRLLDPSHVRAFTGTELVDLVPGGVEGMSYADTNTLRFPVEGVIGEHSDGDAAVALLRSEAAGEIDPTGFGPIVEDDQTIVSFVMCVVHAERAS